VSDQDDSLLSSSPLSEVQKQQILELCQNDADAGAILHALTKGLPTEQRQAAAAAAAAEVPAEAKPGLVATVVQGLPTPQRQAAAAAAAEVPAEARPALVATVVQGMPPRAEASRRPSCDQHAKRR
jgi:hypothetical protein